MYVLVLGICRRRLPGVEGFVPRGPTVSLVNKIEHRRDPEGEQMGG